MMKLPNGASWALIGTFCVSAFGALEGCSPDEVPPGEEPDKPSTSDGNVDAGVIDSGPPGDAGDDPSGDVEARIAPIADAPFGSDFVLDGDGSLNPEGRVLVYEWRVQAPDEAGCEGALSSADEAVAEFTPSCRGEHVAHLTVSTLDGVESEAEEAFTVLNNPPNIAGLAQEATFSVGEDVVLTANATDEDDDDTVCIASLAADNEGDPEGLVFPSEPSADCRITLQTPARLDTWKIQVVADDGFDESMPATLEISPDNGGPTIDGIELDQNSVGYSCDADGCSSDLLEVTVAATDDADAFEDLTIELLDDTSDAPAGVVVDISTVEHGVFAVRWSRDEPGPLAGAYTLKAVVTEQSSPFGDPASTTLSLEVDVDSEAPQLTDITADDVGHAYDADSGLYEATIEVSFTASDPENNLLPPSVALVSCPTAAAGTSDCGGAGLAVTVVEEDGSWTFALSAAELDKLAGEYTFAVTADDADGNEASVVEVASVLNAAPVLGAGLAPTRQQSFVSGAHQAVFPLFQDAEGDPMTFSLSVTCPDGSNPDVGGSCASGQTVSISDDGVLTIRGPASDTFLGNYVIEGDVTDGAASLAANLTLKVENTAPTLVRTSSGTQSCDHVTSNGTVENESPCRFQLRATSFDENGDPVALESVGSLGGGYSLLATMPASGPAGPHSVDFDIEASYEDFLDSFDAPPQVARFRVVDAFGDASPEVTIQPRLLNRPPTLTSKGFHGANGTGTPALLDNNQLDTSGTTGTAQAKGTCFTDAIGRTRCPVPPAYAFSLVVESTDPDGDPLEADLALSCTGELTDEAGGSLTEPRPLPADGIFGLRLPGSTGLCSLSLQGPYARAWGLMGSQNCSRFGCFPTGDYYIRCTLNGSGSSVGDGIDSTTLGASLNVYIRPTPTDDPVQCP